MKLIDDIVYEVDCKMVSVSGDVDIDIGANPSAEGGDEELESSGAEMVNNVAHSFRLQSTSFDKKSYMATSRAIKTKLQETNPDRVETFEKQAAGFVKKMLGDFKNYEFYTGESMDVDGMIALLNYREDGITPYFTFFKDGLKEVKL
ncbi:translationally-controlled tumor protein [Syncephalis plumigaleata]|nr:translationally-controlled tumor protein [Syncephalis plumigaleata]